MNPERFDQAADDALDREVRGLLAIEPSPQFHARVGARIASESAAGSARRAVWLGAGLALAAAGIIIVAVVSPRQAPRSAHGQQRPALAARGSVGMAPAISADARRLHSTEASPSIEAFARGARSAEAFARRSRSADAFARQQREPEILLAPDETRALRALLAGVRDGRIDLTPVSQATTPDVMELEPIRNLVIAPIVIAPVEGVYP